MRSRKVLSSSLLLLLACMQPNTPVKAKELADEYPGAYMPDASQAEGRERDFVLQVGINGIVALTLSIEPPAGYSFTASTVTGAATSKASSVRQAARSR